MKTISRLCVALTVATGVCACSGPRSSGDAPSLGAASGFGDCEVTGEPGSITLTTQKPDTLTVMVVLPSPGWWNGTSPTDIKDGYEYCLAADIAHRGGLHALTLKNVSWDQFISGTQQDYDIGMAQSSITDKRKEVMDFSIPYFSTRFGVATQADSGVTEDTIRDKKVGVLQGNTGAVFVHDVLKPKEIATFQSETDLFTALSSGQVDAVLTDTVIVLTRVKASNGALVVVGQYPPDQPFGVVLPKGSANTPEVDKAISTMEDDGTLKELTAAYLTPLFGINPDDVPVWGVM